MQVSAIAAVQTSIDLNQCERGSIWAICFTLVTEFYAGDGGMPCHNKPLKPL
jgi:hypothetical protein